MTTALPVPTLAAGPAGLTLEGVALADIADRFGTPTYVYSRAALTAAYESYQRALGLRKSLICYAVKANSSLGILSVFAKLGVSGVDSDLATLIRTAIVLLLLAVIVALFSGLYLVMPLQVRRHKHAQVSLEPCLDEFVPSSIFTGSHGAGVSRHIMVSSTSAMDVHHFALLSVKSQ